MNPDDLHRLVLDADPGALALALSGLADADRRPLAAPAWSLYRAIERGEPPRSLAEDVARAFRKALEWHRQPAGTRTPSSPWTVSRLAVLGLCTLERARRLDTWFFRDEECAALDKIIRDRRPGWLDDWIQHRLGREFVGIPWAVLRGWIRDGICKKPEGNDYIRAFAHGMMVPPTQLHPELPPLSERLRADRELLEDEAWRLFEVESRAFLHDWNTGKDWPGEYETWTMALVRLSKEGDLDRQRLLDASLAGLSTGLPANVLSGFRRLHERLEPEVGEMATRESRYRELLASRVGHVVSFGLTVLSAVERGRGVDAAALLEALGAVFALSSKGQPLAALRLLDRVRRRLPEVSERVAALCIPALRHASPDVAEAALTILEDLPQDAVSRVASEISEAAEWVGAALRSRVEQLAGPLEARSRSADEEAERLAATHADRSAALSPTLLTRVGLGGGNLDEMPVAPLRWDLFDGAFTQANLVQPVSSLEELIDSATHAVELVDSPDEVERILDGLSRFCDQRPSDFDLRTGSVARRIQHGERQEAARGLVSGWGGVSLLFADLLLEWLTGQVYRTPQPTYAQAIGVFPFLEWRIRELGARIRQRRAAPLLSAPTHAGGWVDPSRFIERLHYFSDGPEILRSDLIQALLRLAPDGRALALESASDLPGEVGRVVRFALGGDEARGSGARRDIPLWIAAGRARCPHGSLVAALSSEEDASELGPDGIEPARIRWRSALRTTEVRGRTYKHPALEIDVSPPLPHWAAVEEAGFLPDPPIVKARQLWERGLDALGRGPRPLLRELPTVTLHRAVPHSWQTADFSSAWIVRWLAFVWPLQLDAYFTEGARGLLFRIDMDAATTAPHFAFVEPLFEPGRPWSEPSMLLLCLALSSRDADARGLAQDALIEGARDGRAQAPALGDVLARLAEGGWLKLNRLGESLGSVARASRLHAALVADVLEVLLGTAESLPRNATALLELLMEILSELGQPVSNRLRDVLATVRGSSRSASLAKALLSIEGEADRVRTERIRNEVEIRLTRAELWQAAEAGEDSSN